MWARHQLHNIPDDLKNDFKDDLKDYFKDDLAFLKKCCPFTKKMWNFKDDLAFSKKHFPSERRYGKSCWVWMGPHLPFCADSGAPILKTPNCR